MMKQQTTLNCRGHLLDLSAPVVMGILNVTPDSFYDGGFHSSTKAALKKAAQLLEEGATILDIGGMSSRPGAALISAEEELQRVLPVVETILNSFPQALISIDTVRSEVAKACLEAGAHIINDISGGKIDKDLISTVVKYRAPYILMHMQGKPSTMQQLPTYDNVVDEVLAFFIKKIAAFRKEGIKDIIIDPGFGFGKTIEHNYQLLRQLSDFQVIEAPILAGISRKSMIYKALGIQVKEALNGTSALHMVTLQQGAKILRVHDVKEAVEVVKLYEMLLESKVKS